MKKIVTILAAAMLATSVFAADVAAQIQIDGKVFDYDGKNFKMIEANQYDPSGDSDLVWKLSVAGDKAGAYISTWDMGTAVSNKAIWFKPFDSLKVTVGDINVERFFRPQFGWWAATTKFDGGPYGYLFDYATGAFKLQLSMAPGAGAYFFDFSKEGFDMIGNFWFLAQYAFDFATFEFYVAKGAMVQPHGFYGNWAPSDLAIGLAGGTWNYMQNCYFADLAVAFKKDGDSLAFDKFIGQIYAQYFINGIGAQLINCIGYNEADGFGYGFELKVSYALDGVTPYIQIDGYNIMKDAWSATVDLGASLSVGACAIDTKLQMPLGKGKDFKICMPIQFNIAF